MKNLFAAFALGVCIALPGCANLQTLSRETDLPVNGPGKAIHLDAQQRLVVFGERDDKGFLRYCAEPSPDAFAAYAASLGFSLADPSNRAASLSQAGQSTAASIGLRTQSITLMRDALYRMCESYMNGSLGEVQVATLLGRSQDLTAVILAVEQLTGVVAANQAIVSGASGAGASASLAANQKILGEARKDEEEKEKSLATAKAEKEEIEKAVQGKRGEVSTAEAEYKEAIAPDSKATDEDRNRLQQDYQTKKAELLKAESQLNEAEQQFKVRQALLDESKRIREAIENARDAALSSTIATASGEGMMNSVVSRKELSKEATQQIANAVESMIKTVLSKEYTQDACMAMLTSKNARNDENYKTVQALCVQLISKSIREAIAKSTSTYGPDAATEKIDSMLRSDKTLRSKLREWLASNEIDVPVSAFLSGAEYSQFREKFIREFGIQ